MEKIKKNRKLLSIFLIGEILIFGAIVIESNWSSERVNEPNIEIVPMVLVMGVIGIGFIMLLYKLGKCYIKKATKGILELIFLDFLVTLAFGLVIAEVLTNKSSNLIQLQIFPTI